MKRMKIYLYFIYIVFQLTADVISIIQGAQYQHLKFVHACCLFFIKPVIILKNGIVNILSWRYVKLTSDQEITLYWI